MSERINYLVWYKTANEEFRIMLSESRQISTVEKLPNNINQFEMNDKSKAIDENLILYCDNIKIWRDEIVRCLLLKIPFDYFDNSFFNEDLSIFYRHHSNNVCTFIKRFLKSDYKTFDIITKIEESYYLKCNRGGLMYCDRGVFDCYAFDFRFFYPSIMASKDFKIATKEGVESEFTEIPKIFQYGIYNIKIISDDINFKKIFAFSKDNHYTHYSLNFILFLKRKYKMSIEFVILSNTALIYSDDKIVSGYSIFYCWYMRLLDLKIAFPTNKLVKTLGSTSWGQLSAQNIIVKTESQIEQENLLIAFDNSTDYKIVDIIVKNKEDVYKLLDTKKTMYKLQFRLKAFVTDYARVKIAKVALLDLDDVVRIQTDGIVYSCPKKFSIDNYVIDSKHTGEFEWFNVNKWKLIKH